MGSHRSRHRRAEAALVLGIGLLSATCDGDKPDEDGPATDPGFVGRCADQVSERQPFFGDTHVHTALSLDAALQGTQVRPLEAYRFALGEPIAVQPLDEAGEPTRTIQLAQPLDFVVLSDHAEFLGTVTVCTDPALEGYDSDDCQTYRDDPDFAFVTLNALTGASHDDVAAPDVCAEAGVDCDAATSTAWAEVQSAAEAVYDRTDACTFTSFVGYEWSAGPATYNLHRNVVFKDEIVPARPHSYFESPTVEDLWAWLRTDCIDAGTGCDAVTIPHNPNLSNGLMFDPVQTDGTAADADWAAERRRMEPLVEVFQHKGDSECRPGDPSGDPACSFEDMPYNSLSGANLDLEGEPQITDSVRDALGRGLELQGTLGENPFRYGIIASTDTHLGAPGLSDEATFPGHGGAGESNRDALAESFVDVLQFNPGGLAVLWAEENSRESLFNAMVRKEAYGTSGPRIVLRFFGGDLPEDLCGDPALVAEGYANGVPMGGALQGAPRFVVSAQGDAHSAPLEKLQIVKGWTEGGEARWSVTDLATASGDVSLDTETCAQSGSGTHALCASWTDPDFDPEAPAFWYVRVLETETCRWSQHQCIAQGIDCDGDVDEAWAGCCDGSVPTTVQERAWSSPIWYTP